MLDNSIILFGSNMANSDLHNNNPLPQLLLGKGGGIKGGQHLAMPKDTPHANILLTMVQRAGLNLEKFGDSSGPLARRLICAGGACRSRRLVAAGILCGSAGFAADFTAQPDGSTPLQWAVFHGNTAEAKRLLKAGADVKARQCLWRQCHAVGRRRIQHRADRAAAQGRRGCEFAESGW